MNKEFNLTHFREAQEKRVQEKKIWMLKKGWTDNKVSNGHLPECYNFIPQKSDIDNYLEVNVGSGTDVALKLMNLENETCVRYVFINSGSTYTIRNIPEGRYYLKLAYGKDWLSKIVNGQCKGKFIRNPLYESGEDLLDFNIIHKSNSYSIPSFSLHLDVVSTGISNSFNSSEISESEFNK
ncbi:MAG: hypothetical protein RL264_166 [Bacteroidota bacterium]|jgi:hypothetical protein